MEEQNKCNTPNILDFGEPHKENCIIKVIGVGGGGGNAVNHMYKEGIHDVSFVLCNTDAQALNDSPVPVHLQLGKEGLGAGNKPAKAREAAEESLGASLLRFRQPWAASSLRSTPSKAPRSRRATSSLTSSVSSKTVLLNSPSVSLNSQ